VSRPSGFTRVWAWCSTPCPRCGAAPATLWAQVAVGQRLGVDEFGGATGPARLG
jgi:hypothetical protein